MKATCPKNPEHEKFITTAHVMEEWLVDPAGNFISRIASIETTVKPDPDNIWFCDDCGAEAEVES